jgi:hypothetical protein
MSPFVFLIILLSCGRLMLMLRRELIRRRKHGFSASNGRAVCIHHWFVSGHLRNNDKEVDLL